MASLGGGLGSQRGELPLMADVNVTSLVDVMLVLLIIFMITAPIMQGGVDVELPRAEAQTTLAQRRNGGHGQSGWTHLRGPDAGVLQ